ncbi:MAG: metallophosphoesterase [Candidatus Shapirobacteria bacterium]|jgi:predicted MPP superfamily phosphohydrolase
MRVQIFSDLHLEFYASVRGKLDPPLYFAINPEAELLIIAGDLTISPEASRVFFQWLADKHPDLPVLYVLGNHEFYDHDLAAYHEYKKMCSLPNVHVLDNEACVLQNIVFVGSTLWSDLSNPLQAFRVRHLLTDYDRIRHQGGMIIPDMITQQHRIAVKFISRALAKPQFADKKQVVITHHCPTYASIPDEMHQSMSFVEDAYASNLAELMLTFSPQVWVHGHVHTAVDYLVGDTRVISNPYGYPQQRAVGYRGDLLLDL